MRDLLPWAPTLLGVLALFVLLIVAVTRFTPGSQAAALPPAPTFLQPPAVPPGALPGAVPPGGLPPQTLPSGPLIPGAVAGLPTTGVPPGPAQPPGAVSTSPTARPSRQQVRTTSPQPARTSGRATAAPGPVTGAYRVLNSYETSFIGEVLVANSSGGDRDWRVELRFPATVGNLVASWVEGAPQASLRRSGDSYIWSSGVPVPAGSQVPLRFHFSRSGSGNLPSTCTVNGASCTGLR